MPSPLVSIGIPTYGRATSLERAIRSALAQDHVDVEVVVSDDASPDGTVAMVRRLAAEDPRVQLVEQTVNLGHARNFQAVLEAARGEYFMWLSDDDWIDPGYVSRCLGELVSEPGRVLVAGLARYCRGDGDVVDERPLDLLHRRRGARVLAYLARVNMNGALFGVARRRDLLDIGFRDEVGGDWLLVAAMAARGTITTPRDVHVHRSFEGLSSDAERLGRSFGMRGLLARYHHVDVARRFRREILTSPHYAPLGPVPRAVVGAAAAVLIVVRFPLYGAVMAALRRVGLGGIETRAIAWVRKRDRSA